MQSKVLSLLFTLTVVLSACATGKSDPFTPEALVGGQSAIVYIYRPPAKLQWNIAAAFEVDKRPAGKIKPGGYLKIRLEPGIHAIGWREQAFGLPLYGRSIKVPVQTGESYYVRADRNLETLTYSPSGPMPIYGMKLTLVPNHQAIAELKQKQH